MSDASAPLVTPFGRLLLRRYPIRKGDTLRAWDAADEYLLNELAGQGIAPDTRVLILNDNFGALSVSLAGFSPTLVSDSSIAQWSVEENLKQNARPVQAVELMSTLDEHQGVYDLVLVRVTKTLALLEDELIRLKPHLHARSRVIGLGMSKQIHTSTLKLFETIIGPTRTSLARKKARLIYAEPDMSLVPGASPYPSCYRLEGTGYRLCNHANVFSRERLDIGARFFLQHIPAGAEYREIIDLGCGNGVIGLLAAEANPQSRLWFVDESHMAVASARENFRQSGLGNKAEFLVGDCLGQFEKQSADLILCNPPFHQQQVVGDFVAWRMFQQARGVLRPGGTLRIIGNRHLNYQAKLKKLFGNVEQIAANAKFVILQAIKRR